MRGKEIEVKAENTAKRITPAYAGKRFLKHGTISQKKDHPRLCGEKSST